MRRFCSGLGAFLPSFSPFFSSWLLLTFSSLPLRCNRTASVFLRRGLATPISLDDLLPPPHSEESSYLLDDLSALLSYHSSKRLSQFESSARRYAGDCDADDPILVEGDGKGKSRVEMVREERPRWPVLGEIGMYAQAFQEQLKEVFAV